MAECQATIIAFNFLLLHVTCTNCAVNCKLFWYDQRKALVVEAALV